MMVASGAGRGRAARCGALAGLLLTGCATLDTADLDRARATVGIAQRNPRIPAEQSVDLREAERQLGLADRAVADDAPQETVSHYAYLAEAHARIAQAAAAAHAANSEAAELEALFSSSSTAQLADARSEAARARQSEGEIARRARALSAEQTERGLVLTLGGVLFRLGSADLQPAAKISIARLAGFLIALPERSAVVEGHTDNTGSIGFNRELSQLRAIAVREFMVASGVERERIVADGYAERYPVAGNDTEEGRKKNRRVEIVILDPGESPEQGRRQVKR